MNYQQKFYYTLNELKRQNRRTGSYYLSDGALNFVGSSHAGIYETRDGELAVFIETQTKHPDGPTAKIQLFHGMATEQRGEVITEWHAYGPRKDMAKLANKFSTMAADEVRAFFALQQQNA
jgi:hypothetical protein